MQFLADMGVAKSVVEWLRGRGHDATHLKDQGLQRLPNGDIFKKTISERRVLLTFDLDFSEIIALSENQNTSVIVFRLHNARAKHVIERLEKVLIESSDALKKGAIISVSRRKSSSSAAFTLAAEKIIYHLLVISAKKSLMKCIIWQRRFHA